MRLAPRRMPGGFLEVDGGAPKQAAAEFSGEQPLTIERQNKLPGSGRYPWVTLLEETMEN
ncbi:MAG: hypothetical protein IPM53_19990 [Anaerolineaceae bacterium]|nr:hypothetical protein [Anaerolineaceae bacterium]